jgi:hypothetical protein
MSNAEIARVPFSPEVLNVECCSSLRPDGSNIVVSP